MPDVQSVAEFLSAFCCSIFAGAAIYITLVEHPARVEAGTATAAAVFPGSYRRAAMMQAPLAILGFVFSVIAWIQRGDVWWLIGGLLLVSVVPITLIVIMPTNKELLTPLLNKPPGRIAELLARWGKLHAIRTAVSCLALVIFLYLLSAP